MKALFDLHDQGNIELFAPRCRIERSIGCRFDHVAWRGNLRHSNGGGNNDSQEGNNLPDHMFTSSPSCCEITRLSTAKRSSPVFSRTKAFFASDQPSLKLVESAEIQISRTGVFGEITNFAGSGSSHTTSSLPLPPSTSKPCSSPASSSRRFNSSSAVSHFF